MIALVIENDLVMSPSNQKKLIRHSVGPILLKINSSFSTNARATRSIHIGEGFHISRNGLFLFRLDIFLNQFYLNSLFKPSRLLGCYL